jgi:hypothetical protein
MSAHSLKRPISSRIWTPLDRPEQAKRPELLLRPDSGRFALFRLIEVVHLID